MDVGQAGDVEDFVTHACREQEEDVQQPVPHLIPRFAAALRGNKTLVNTNKYDGASRLVLISAIHQDKLCGLHIAKLTAASVLFCFFNITLCSGQRVKDEFYLFIYWSYMACGFFAKGLGGFIGSNKARQWLTGFSQYKAIQEVHVLVYRLNKREKRVNGMCPNVFLLLCIA